MGRNILHVDMNCFYASVEMQRHPELRGKPVAVCGKPELRHGIVLTANYLAKPCGVKTGMTVWQARQLCPELVVLPPDMGEYIRFSRMAREIYEDYTDRIEPFGLDENWLDVTGSVGLFGDPCALAREIRARIRFELGITASIGIADNKITAKLGSDYKKPDAQTRIGRDNYAQLVYPLPVTDLLYVGPSTGRRLRSIGIFTIGQLAQLPPDLLARRFGKNGLLLHCFANGWDATPVRRADHRRAAKSVSNSATSPRDLENESDVHLMLALLSESVCARLREAGARCTVVELEVRDAALERFTRQQRLAAPTDDGLELSRAAMALFRENYTWPRPVRSIGVRGSELVYGWQQAQLSFDPDETRRQRRAQLDRAVDGIRRRYGYRSIGRALFGTDPVLGKINPKDDHTVHPIGYFAG